MTSNYSSQETSLEVLKSDSARQRWEWFHRAIALAKQSNSEALREADEPPQVSATDNPVRRDDPRLSIAR
jgi:hypothetical protein